MLILGFNQTLKAQCDPIILSFEALQSPPWPPFCDEIPFRIVIGNNCGQPLTGIRAGISIAPTTVKLDVPGTGGFGFPWSGNGSPGLSRHRYDSESFDLDHLETRTFDFWLKGESCTLSGDYQVWAGIVNAANILFVPATGNLAWPSPFASCRLIDGSLTQLIGTNNTVQIMPDLPACDVYNSNLIPRVFVVTNDLIVDVNGLYCMSPINITQPTDRVISMQKDARIIVKNGSHLQIEDFEIKGCDEMWQSIVVENGGRLTLNNCTIRDAWTAVEVEPGGIVTLHRNEFRNNAVSLNITKLNSSQPSAQVSITRNLFHGVGTLKAPFENQIPNAGIIVRNIPELNLPGSSGGGNTFSNTFRNMRNGVISTNSDVSIRKAIFEDILQQNGTGGVAVRSRGGADYRTVTIDGAEFSNCFTGVSSSRDWLTVENSTMAKMNNGILITNAASMLQRITDNKISASDRGIEYTGIEPLFLKVYNNRITMNNPTDALNSFAIRGNLTIANSLFSSWLVENNSIKLEDARFGIFVSSGAVVDLKDNAISTAFGSTLLEEYNYIFLDGTQSPSVSCNSIFGNAKGDNYKDARGITLNGTSFGAIECNSITKTEIGIDVNDMSMDTRLSGNTLDRHQTGLQLRENANIGQQTFNGNDWTFLNSVDDPDPLDDLFGARHLGGSQTQGQSQFIVNNSADDEYMPSLPSANLSWFVSNSNGLNFTCPVNSVCGFSTNGFIADEDDKLKKNIINNQLASDGFNAALRYAGARQLYRGLQESTAQINTGGLFDSFLSAESTTSVGQFNAIENDISDLFTIDSLEQDSLLEYWETVVDNTAAIWLKDSLLNETTDPAEINILINDKSTLELEREQANVNAQLIYKQLETDKLAAIPQITSNNQAISTTAIYETNQKTVTNTLLKTLAIGLEPDSVQLVDLEAIANQCPLAGGEAVYHARALVQGGYYDDEALCAAANQNSEMEKEEQAVTFSIFPNPSNGKFSLLLPADVKAVTISNTMGQVIQRWDDRVFEAYWEVPNVNLSAGTYYCSVETINGATTKAFVVIK
ncbi:MAG: hypothetical protein ACI8YQ_002263 [Polaribacter sp.]